MVEEINLDFDGDNKQINLDNNIGDSSINVKSNQPDDSLIGVELLANKVTSKLDNTEGYSSGEESINTKKIKEDYDFFNDNDKGKISPNDIELNNDNLEDPPQNKSIPINDPMMDSIKGSESGFKAISSMNSQEIKNEKIDLIYKFKKLEDQGIRTTMNYNMNSHLEDMRNEYLKLRKQREVDNSVRFQRKVMMAAITGLEYLNNKFDPFDVKLDGWSESVNENIYDYDEVFEELAEKYGGKSDMAPELKLLMMLGGSAFMFHLTNTMFKSSIPGMDDIMKQNPDLMHQFAKAAVGSIGKQPEQGQNHSGGGINLQPQHQPPRQTKSPKKKSTKLDMEGPEGLDNIINQMNIQPSDIPDLDNISLLSGDTDRISNRSDGGLTLNM
tara:strand:- start:3577 stop:4731 length:1155 start_codon:yes stop_codon:yes gene_type:complete